jgi:hypothetical protein
MMSKTGSGLTALEQAVLEVFSNIDSQGIALRSQIATARVRNRENTGHGFFTYVDVDHTVAAMGDRKPRDMREEVYATVAGAEYGMGFILWLKDGYVDCLEGYCFSNDDTKGWDLEHLSFEVSDLLPFPRQ